MQCDKDFFETEISVPTNQTSVPISGNVESARQTSILSGSPSNSLVARFGNLMSPQGSKLFPVRCISSLTSHGFDSFGSDSLKEDAEDPDPDPDNVLNTNIVLETGVGHEDEESELKNGDLIKDARQLINRTRTFSYNSHDNYDARELEVKDSELIPVDTSYDDDSLSPPQNRRMKRIDVKSALCIDEHSFENMKHHTRRLFNKKYDKNRQNRSKSEATTKKMKRIGKQRNNLFNNLTACKSNTDDFSLRHTGTGRKHSSSNNILTAHEVDILSDMSDQDPDSSDIEKLRRPRIPAPFVHHIPKAVQVVKCVKRCASNMYSEVNQIMEENAKKNEYTTDLESIRMRDELQGVKAIADEVPEKLLQTNASEVNLERYSSNFLEEEKTPSVPIEQTFSGFNKEMALVLKQPQPDDPYLNHATQISSMEEDMIILGDGESSIRSYGSNDLNHPISPNHDVFSSAGVVEIEEHPILPPVSVKDRVKAFEIQNALESSLAAGQQGPSTPRSRGRIRTTSQGKRGPPQCLFESFQPSQINETLKLIFVSAPHTETAKTSIVHGLTTQKKKRILSSENSMDMNVYTWDPNDRSDCSQSLAGCDVRMPKFRIYDLKGGSLDSGAHHATQSLFFSPSSLYVIVWDLAVGNKDTFLQETIYDSEDDFSCDSYDFECDRFEEIRLKAINRDIDRNVLYWIDVIAELNFPGCVILPVVLYSDNLNVDELKQRSEMLKARLKDHRERHQASLPKIVYGTKDKVPVVVLQKDGGLDELRHEILKISSIDNVCKASSFKHHFKVLSPMIVSVKDAVSVFWSRNFKVVQFSELFLEISKRPPVVDNFSKELVRDALSFLSSTGDILYFGDQVTCCANPLHLKKFIVLDPKWLCVAISCILSRKKIKGVRDQEHGFSSFEEDTKCFDSLYIKDFEAIRIWEDSKRVREQNNLISDPDNDDLFYFLKEVCEHCGILIPLAITDAPCYLLPRLTAEPIDSPWTFKTKHQNQKTILCHTWLIREILPVTFMDEIVAAVVKQLVAIAEQGPSDSRIRGISLGTFVHQVLCYKTSLYAKVVELVPAHDGTEVVCNITELYVLLAHSDSPKCVGIHEMRDTDYKLIICGKGFVGNNAEKIWKLGYSDIRKAVEEVVSKFTKVRVLREVACPDCMLSISPANVSSWSEEHVMLHGDEAVVCSNPNNVHRVNSQLLRGEFVSYPCDDDCSTATGYSAFSSISHFTSMTSYTYDTYDRAPSRGIPDILPSVVLVGLWDTKSSLVRSLGSGFIADRSRGLILTAGHIFYDLKSEEGIGKPFFGIKGATAVVGIYDEKSRIASFKYTADIVVHDLEKADACVLGLKSKFESPVAAHGCRLPFPQKLVFGPIKMKAEGLQRLTMTDKIELEESVRVIGYNQEGEGLERKGENVDHSPCYERGSVIKHMNSAFVDKKSDEMDNDKVLFSPQLEIVIKCPTKSGHSGGPCVNDKGQVVGIVGRADAFEPDRCYLAPSTLLYRLLKKAQGSTRGETRVRFNSKA
mmetsp:Transcript_12189/g.22846  ORF Transcript_12189/g.22846 Transcript_12189/m.22846 type:complete len:1512 (-) Transcript_12189:105-4640(-)|eukprot:CAMPEP_0176490384 /NCGR_PEP_ID=MMETSP0200_2-20121128/7838_1 /TAXON_ID=947934 /ORGANISM="Chaetoceros sp., Strain GSL56" /LENGTH=1511 /DNA_ID=CAMNT_0017887679 /DNA_START=283 /DNA_END=4818 /DNA_ORIENTATION=-